MNPKREASVSLSAMHPFYTRCREKDDENRRHPAKDSSGENRREYTSSVLADELYAILDDDIRLIGDNAEIIQHDRSIADPEAA